MACDLEQLERLHAAATPGPWKHRTISKTATVILAADTPLCATKYSVNKDHDAAYIVGACNAAPELIAENRALKEKVRELERQKRVLVEKMAIDILCSECPVSEACPYENATFIDLEDCAKQLEKWSENAAKEAGEDAAIVG